MSPRMPDFDNLRKVLANETPDRPTLYEFLFNTRIGEKLVGRPTPSPAEDYLAYLRHRVQAFALAGYDYATCHASPFHFPNVERDHAASMSMDQNVPINSVEDFEQLDWLEPEDFSTAHFEAIAADLPGNLKLIPAGPGGILENVMSLCGFENLAIFLAEEPDMVAALFDAVGDRLVRYYAMAVDYDSVGALMINDDWGFKTQTMLRPDDMRRYVIPWHQRMVEVAHNAGKPALLHSCGNLEAVWEDIIEVIGFDGKHSYEDAIMPVEDAIAQYGDRIAILGGIDVDFLCRAPLEELRARCERLLAAHEAGGYALGSGNSIPLYVPDERFFAMNEVFLNA